jgi:hypothetical protein
VAVHFESAGERIAIRQTRRVLRAMPAVVVLLLAIGFVAAAMGARHDGSDPNLLFLAPISLLGWAIIFGALRPFSVTIRAVLDRAHDRIEVHGRGWLMRRWDVERRLRDVAAIDLRGRTVFYGYDVARMVYVYAVFADGTEALLWSPAYATQRTITQRVAMLRALTTR